MKNIKYLNLKNTISSGLVNSLFYSISLFFALIKAILKFFLYSIIFQMEGVFWSKTKF